MDPPKARHVFELAFELYLGAYGKVDPVREQSKVEMGIYAL
jgi:hypothetical protein